MAAEDEVNDLLEDLVPIVHEQLTEEGGIYPFGAALTENSEKEVIRVTDDEEADLPENPVEDLQKAIRSRIAEGGVKLVALITDVTVDFEEGKGDEDAIHFAFEHRDGDAIEVFLPYARVEDEIVFGEFIAQLGINTYFSA